MAEFRGVPFYNQVMDKTSMRQLIARLVAHLGSRHTSQVLDQLKTLGFKHATQTGISLGIDDLVTTPSKSWLIQDAEQQAHLSETLQQCGSIHAVEKLRQLVETWYTTSEYLKREMTPNFRMTDPLNPVHLMSFSGARGSVSQVHQLVGMRGLMSDPQGQIIDLPIESNFREGLSLTEYIISCYGARKGVVDTAVRTADAGYLTRRLVEVVQHVVVREIDCGVSEGVILRSIQDARRKPFVHWEQRVVGRVLATPIYVDGQLLSPRNQEITLGLARRLAALGATGVAIRSPMTCQGEQWVCQLCYGWSPSHGGMVTIGEAIGIMAGQSIGEPGTQLTLRTFHTGGVFTGDIAEHVRAPFNGIVHFNPDVVQLARTRHGRPAFLCQQALRVIIRGQDKEQGLRVPANSLLLVSHNEYVEAKQVIAEVRAPIAPLKEKVQKHFYSHFTGEMHWGKAVCHAPRRTRLSSCLVTSHLWVLSGQLYSLPRRVSVFYQSADHIEPFQLIGGHTGAHAHYRANDSHFLAENQAEVRKSQCYWDQSRWCYEFNAPRDSLRWDVSLPSFQWVVPLGIVRCVYPPAWLISGKAQQVQRETKPTIAKVCSFQQEDGYRIQSGGILQYGTVQIQPIFCSGHAAISVARSRRKESLAKLSLHSSRKIEIPANTRAHNHSPTLRYNPSLGLSFRVIKGGSLFWIPEETYWVVSTLFLQDEEMIAEQTEIASGVFSKSAGLMQIRHTEQNLFQLSVLPGVAYPFETLALEECKHNTLIAPGELVINGFPLNTWSFVQLFSSKKGQKQWLIRPVLQYHVDPRPKGKRTNYLQDSGIEAANSEWAYCLPHKNGEYIGAQPKVKVPFIQTCLLSTFKTQHANTQRYRRKRPLDRSVPNRFGGTLHSFIGTEPRATLIILSRSDLLRAPIPPMSWKDPSLNPTRMSYDNQSIGLVGDLALPSHVVHYPIQRVRSLAHHETWTTPKCSLLAIDEHAMIRWMPGLAGDCASLKSGLLKLAQLVCDTLALQPKSLGSEPSQVILIHECSAVLRPARPTLVTAKAAVHTRHAGPVKEGDALITLVYERLRSGDIIQGLPKVEQLLEARSIHARAFQLDRPESDWKRELLFGLEDACMQASRTSLEIRQLQLCLIDEVQRVYQSQGVLISDKHLETIVRQMSSKVLIADLRTSWSYPPFEAGAIRVRFDWLHPATVYHDVLPGQFVLLTRTRRIAYLPVLPIPYRPLLLGITRASFHTNSLLSEASFQHTVKALSLSALQGRIDWLRGLKERVIVGGLIPAGTGCEQVSCQDPWIAAKTSFGSLLRSQHHFKRTPDQILRRCASRSRLQCRRFLARQQKERAQ